MQLLGSGCCQGLRATCKSFYDLEIGGLGNLMEAFKTDEEIERIPSIGKTFLGVHAQKICLSKPKVCRHILQDFHFLPGLMHGPADGHHISP